MIYSSLNKQETTLTYSFPSFEPVHGSLFSSNHCFLFCMHVSQETGKVVWCSCLFKNFLQFVVIHIVKGFSIVNEADVDVFLEFPGIYSRVIGLRIMCINCFLFIVLGKNSASVQVYRWTMTVQAMEFRASKRRLWKVNFFSIAFTEVTYITSRRHNSI